jgi:hypothetical protein
MPDLDLIKQEEQGVRDRHGRPVPCPWIPRLREDEEFVRPQRFSWEEQKGESEMNCPNESEH